MSKAYSYAAALSLGAIVFLTLTAAIVAGGGRALVEQVTFTSLAGRVIRTIAGLLLIVLGLVQIEKLRLPLYRVADLARPLIRSQALTRRHAPVVAFAIFGFAYLLAGFG